MTLSDMCSKFLLWYANIVEEVSNDEISLVGFIKRLAGIVAILIAMMFLMVFGILYILSSPFKYLVTGKGWKGL